MPVIPSNCLALRVVLACTANAQTARLHCPQVSTEAVHDLVSKGALAMSSPAQLAAKATIIVSMLPSPKIVREVHLSWFSSVCLRRSDQRPRVVARKRMAGSMHH